MLDWMRDQSRVAPCTDSMSSGARRVGRSSRRTEWPKGLGRLIDAMDRSVENLGPEPPAWWQRGQPMQLTMATVAEHVSVQEDIAMTAVAEPVGDEPAAAGDGVGDGAGDEKPAEPCTKRRKTHMPPEVKEWFCSLARVKPDWTIVQCQRFARRTFPCFFEHAHIDTPREWFSHKTFGTALGRPRSLEPAVVLALADIVSRVCSRVCCGVEVLAPPGDTWWRSVPLLRTPYTPIHAITWVLLQETQGRAREGMARGTDTDTSRTVPTKDRVDIERCWHHRSKPHHQHRRDVLQDVASARTPPGISCPTCMPNSFFRARPSPWNWPIPSLLTTSHSESHWTTTTTLTAFLTWLDTAVMNPDGSSAHGSTSWTCVPCTSAKNSWPSIGRRMPTSGTIPTTLPASPTALLTCAASSCAGPTTR